MTEQQVNEKVDLDLATINPQAGEIVVFYVPLEEYDIVTVNDCFRQIEKTFPNNAVITLPKDTDLQQMTKPELRKWIEYAQEIYSKVGQN